MSGAQADDDGRSGDRDHHAGRRSTMNIVFLGTGLIGGGLAEAAVRRGERVVVWNRSLEKTRPLEALGARVMRSPAEAVVGAARVHIALTDDTAVDSVLAAIAPA